MKKLKARVYKSFDMIEKLKVLRITLELNTALVAKSIEVFSDRSTSLFFIYSMNAH